MRYAFILGLGLLTVSGPVVFAAEPKVANSPNGIHFPTGYQNWRIIGVSHRTDKPSLRAVLGNDIAVEAARSGKTNPWPDGAILGKIVWKDQVHKNWPGAIVPGKFVHAEFMFKDAKKYASTGGWGWARWLGAEQKPYGKDANLAQECVACHTPVKGNDWVFTHPAALPAVK